MRLLLLILLAMLGCKDHKPVPIKEHSEWGRLMDKQALYMRKQLELVDEYGWLSPKCDGLLFNSLAAYAGSPVNPLLAEEAPGRWRRYPNFELCKPGSGSATTISRDMFRGLFIYLLKTQNVDAMRRIVQYGEANGWMMGEGTDPTTTFSRTYFNPLIRNQLKRMIDNTEPMLEEVEVASDYEAHLEVLKIYTESLIYGKIDEWDLKTLKYYAENYPRNALFQALYHKFTDGDQDDAISILLDESLFPADRLPTDQDRFAHYIFQRDPGDDWKPCGSSDKRPCEGLTHAGVDFTFAVSLLER